MTFGPARPMSIFVDLAIFNERFITRAPSSGENGQVPRDHAHAEMRAMQIRPYAYRETIYGLRQRYNIFY